MSHNLAASTEGGWKLDAGLQAACEAALDDVEVPVEDEDLGAGATPGMNKTNLWVWDSRLLTIHYQSHHCCIFHFQ